MISYIKVALYTLLSSFLSNEEIKILGPEGCIYFEANFAHGEAGPIRKDTCHLQNGEILEIVGLTDQYKSRNKLESGGTIINAAGAIIKQGRLFIQNSTQVQFISSNKIQNGNDDNNDDEGNLLTNAIESKTIFVLRADALDSKTTKTVSELSNDIFGTGGDVTNLKHQFEACSYGKSVIKPFKGKWRDNKINAGVGEVYLNMNVRGEDQRNVRVEMMKAAKRKYGDLFKKVENGRIDLIMLCLPPGTLDSSGSWIAYAFINGILSVFNDNACSSLSLQMHEIGHSLGLAHSGENAEYDDKTCLMGASYTHPDAPLMCFNAAINWQLGWYPNGRETIARDYDNNFYSGRLFGVAEYDLLRSSTDKVMIKITGYDDDFYVSFNSARGINSGVGDGRDQVLVHSRKRTADYPKSGSKLLAKLGVGQQFMISGPLSTIIRVNTIKNIGTPSYAHVFIGNSFCSSHLECDTSAFCTVSTCDVATGTCNSNHQECSLCGGTVDIEIQTDNYAHETSWEIVNVDDNVKVMSGPGPNRSNYDKHELVNDSKCLAPGNYKFIMKDGFGDGITGNGYYKLKVNSQVIKEGGSFQKIEETSFSISDPAGNNS